MAGTSGSPAVRLGWNRAGGRLKSADKQKVVFHDDLEGTLTEADAWYDEFRRQMDEYADKYDPPLPVKPVKPKSSKSENGKWREVWS